MRDEASLKHRLKRIYAMDQATLNQATRDERNGIEARLYQIALEKHPPVTTPAHFIEKDEDEDERDLPDAHPPLGSRCDNCEQPAYPLLLYTVLRNGDYKNYWVCEDCRPAFEQDERKD